MFPTALALLSIVIVALGFGWLAVRAWHAQRAWIRWPGVTLAGLASLAGLLVALLGGVGLYRLYAPHDVPVPDGSAPSAPEQIARGEHVAAVACAGCHATSHDLPLSGGANLSQDTGLPLGDLYAPNLTPASHLDEMSDGTIFRAIRTGVVDDNRATLMSSAGTRFLADDDTWAVVAYLRHAPPVQNETPEFRPSLLLALLTGAGMVKLEPPATSGPVIAPPKAATAEYGQYISDYMGCADCHGENMDGQVKPPSPRGTNLRAIVPHWTKEQFFTAMRTGVGPDGDTFDSVMPWQSTGRLDDVELEALYQYLHGLSPIAGQ